MFKAGDGGTGTTVVVVVGGGGATAQHSELETWKVTRIAPVGRREAVYESESVRRVASDEQEQKTETFVVTTPFAKYSK